MIYLDTHAVVWLFAGQVERFAEPVQDLMGEQPLLVSPMAVLELQYLFETERISEPAQAVLSELGQTIGLSTCDLPFARVVHHALGASWTRDPFDRVIVAQAAAREARLVTKDRRIHEHYGRAVW